MVTKKIKVILTIDEKTLAFLDEIAEKEQRSRSNLITFGALKYAKEKKLEHQEAKDEKEGWVNEY